MASIKDQAKEINLIKILIEITILGGAIWAVAAIVGDERWANRKQTEAGIVALEKTLSINEKLDEIHHFDENLHMPEAVKRSSFVSRVEWLAGRNEFRSDIEELKDYAKEQRNLSMQILNKMSH